MQLSELETALAARASLHSINRPVLVRPVTFERERGVYRVDISPGYAHASVAISDGPVQSERIQRVLDSLCEAGIPIFLIKLHRDVITFGVSDAHLASVGRCLSDATEVFSARTDLALVTVMATNMSDLTGVMARIADALQAAGAHLIGVGDSHNSVQLLIDGAKARDAAAEIQRAFGLQAPDA